MMSNGVTPITQSTDKTLPVNETTQAAGKVLLIVMVKAPVNPLIGTTKQDEMPGTVAIVTIGSQDTLKSTT